ncbi:hypothetical protein K7X08_010845 [Anisodus acutangulus]|uniref:Uncharacterized protein n=1 Tax=Anisodus acutangulus TaxID=402998 RepID=A0A9Q1M1M6_9SOLA|nr:hypothetical protein K7X08_010845 [Anisodus acutangulus]
MEGSNSGVTVVGSDAPSDYHVAPRTTENPTSQVVVSPTLATAMYVGLSVKKKEERAPLGSGGSGHMPRWMAMWTIFTTRHCPVSIQVGPLKRSVPTFVLELLGLVVGKSYSSLRCS